MTNSGQDNISNQIQQMKRHLGMAMSLKKIRDIYYQGEDGFTWQLSCNVGDCSFCQQGLSDKYPKEGICLKQEICIERWQPHLTEPLIGIMASRFPFFSSSMYKCIS